MHAQLPQARTGLLEVVGRYALLVEKLFRALYLVFELVVLNLQRIDRQLIVGIVQLCQQLSLLHIVSLGYMDPGNLSGRLESQAHFMCGLDNTRIEM